uniref:Uncharacterized protein n=1 Tax=Aplanochytrium stocchinoi TaxID=215587 RepID=A0A7S3LHG2_9STRA|mmetsp:Transcript_22281/g.28502  ORF Transcript_22281/g.28502 Transcript_22281/m.28502 type:complete len:200 (-) Transcript_22281:416-1015(-)
MASVLSLSPSRLGVTALNINFARCGYRHNGVFSANHKYLYIKLTSTSTSRRIFSSQRQGEPEEKENATDNSIEERRKRSREITNEMKARIRQGPFYRFGADVDKMGSKVFKTPEKLFDKKRSASIPKLTIETLADTTFELPSKEINKPTLLIVAFNELGFRMAQTWREPIERHFGSGEELHSAFRVLELSVVEGMIRLY